jgi:hypothetical protein
MAAPPTPERSSLRTTDTAGPIDKEFCITPFLLDISRRHKPVRHFRSLHIAGADLSQNPCQRRRRASHAIQSVAWV